MTQTAGHTLTQDASRLLAQLHRGGGWGYLWTDDNGQGKKDTRWFPVGQRVIIPSAWNNVFFGVHPTANRPAHFWQRSTNNTVSVINCVFAEVDGKDMAKPTADLVAAAMSQLVAAGQKGSAKVLQHMAYRNAQATLFLTNITYYNQLAHDHVMSMTPRPSAVVHSGGGYHLYWFLTEPFHLATDEDRQRAKRLQANWVTHVGGDAAAKDPARVLRVVGTQNKKPKYAPDYPIVKLIECDYTRLYTLAALESLVPTPAPAPKATKSHQSGQSGTSTPGSTERTDSVISRFNTVNDLRTLLIQYDYTAAGDNTYNHPNGGESGAMKVYPDGRGFTFSPSDPLYNDGHQITAFDAFCVFEHNGDVKAAVKAAAALLDMTQPSANQNVKTLNQVSEWLTSADLAGFVADQYKAHRTLEDGTQRAEYRSGHTDKLLAKMILDGMAKARKLVDFRTSARQLVMGRNSDGLHVAAMSPTTALKALQRLDFMFAVSMGKGVLAISLRPDFFKDVVVNRLDTSGFQEGNPEVSNLFISTSAHLCDDAYLIGTSPPKRDEARDLARQCEGIEEVTVSGILKTMPAGLSVFALAIIQCLLDAAGSGCTVDDLISASGASKSRAQLVVRSLRQAGFVESHRQHCAPSIHFATRLDLFAAVKQEMTPKLRTFGMGVHRADRIYKQMQSAAERAEDLAKKKGDAIGLEQARARRARAANKRRVTVAQLHGWMTAQEVADHITERVYVSAPLPTKAPSMPAIGALAWQRLNTLRSLDLLTKEQLDELFALNAALNAGVTVSYGPFNSDIHEQVNALNANERMRRAILAGTRTLVETPVQSGLEWGDYIDA